MQDTTEPTCTTLIESRGLVSDTANRPSSLKSAAFVGLRLTSSGSILCTFQAGPEKNAASSTLMICRSRDGGRSWEELPVKFDTTWNGVPGSLSSGEIVEAEPGRLMMVATWFNRSDPQRPLFDPVTEGILSSKQLKAVSVDDGLTWTDWEELNVHGLKGCSSTGPILKWPDGRIAYPFESYKEFDDPNPGIHGAWLLVSRDRGRTFGRPVLVAQDPTRTIFYWDQRLCVGSRSGEYFAMFWSHDLVKKRDLTVHLKHACIDEPGHETTPILDTGIPGQISAPILMESGQLLAFVVDRGRPATLALWGSPNGGASWPTKLVVYEHEVQGSSTRNADNVDFVEYWSDMRKWSFGHPAIQDLGQGNILVAFYAGAPDRMSVHWVRLRIANNRSAR